MGKGLVNVDVSGLAKEIRGGLDDLFTSDEERMEGERKLADILQRPHTMQAMANIKAATHKSWFVAGARPALLWVCAVSLAYNWLAKQFIITGIVVFTEAERAAQIVPLLPSLESAEITGLIATLLGLGTLRTVEKAKGVARSG